MSYKVVVNSETIETFSQNLEEESKILDEMIDDMLLLSSDLEKIYNTPTGKMMRESIREYLTNSKNTCKSLGDYGTTLKKLNRLYGITNDQILKEIGDDK
jgi:hypothetical protein